MRFWNRALGARAPFVDLRQRITPLPQDSPLQVYGGFLISSVPEVQNAMLVKMPRGPVDEDRLSIQSECDPFEAGLRRDLASTPVISYESAIGGWTKRAFDLVVTTLTAPLWLTALLFISLAARLRHRARVVYADERVGYGGCVFRCYRLRLDPPVAEVLVLRPAAPANNVVAAAEPAKDRRSNLRRALERLPQLFNVLKGDMSLVGPAPLSRAEVEPLKTAKRYYLSARPGVVGPSNLVGENQEESDAQYKVYSLCWSLMTDLNLLLAASFRLYGRASATESASKVRK